METSLVRTLREDGRLPCACTPLLCGSALLATALAAPPVGAQPRTIADRTYDCTIIASTREFPYGVDRNGPPPINAWGQVVFFASSRTEAGEAVTEIRVGRGETDSEGVPRTHTVARAGRTFDNRPLGPFDLVSEAVIEDGGRVVFRGWDPPTGGPPGVGIYRVFTNHPATVKPVPLYATVGLGGSFTGLELIDANPSHVLYYASTDEEQGYYRDGALVARMGENDIQVVQEIVLHPFQPWVAFTASLENPSGRAAVYVNGAQRAVGSDASSGFFGLSIGGSAFPLAAWSRVFVPGVDTWQLVRHDGSGAAVFVDADEDPFEFFASPRETSINTRGDIAFISSPDGDGDTLLVADGGDVIHRVVCADMLETFGSTVFSDLALSPRGMNGDGQIAFLARTPELVPETGESQTFIVRADPRPGEGAPPTSCVGLADGTVCDDGDPATLAVCSANECVPDPVNGLPTSCVGLPQETLCDDGDPTTIAFCSQGQCIGFPLPVPEPGGAAAALVALAALAGTARRRSVRRLPRRFARSRARDRAGPRQAPRPCGRSRSSSGPSGTIPVGLMVRWLS